MSQTSTLGHGGCKEGGLTRLATESWKFARGQNVLQPVLWIGEGSSAMRKYVVLP